MATNSTTLTDFLLQTDAQIRIFDLGRRINKINLSDFQKFERGEIPHPYPYEQTAWIGLIYWNKKDTRQHNIWFLRVPLDETGFIQLSSRDEFMHLLMSRFKEYMERSGDSGALEHVLKDNPYVFKPTDDKMAVFHSKALLVLKQDPTQFYPDALKYTQDKDHESWQHLGIQGIADVAVRLDQKEIHQALSIALANMPEPVFCAFCQSMENEVLDIELATVIASRIKNSDSEQLIANGIRALACTHSMQFKNDTLHTVLSNTTSSQNMILVAIAAKAWEVLENEKTLKLFLEKLANSDAGAELFNSLMVDLMFMPGFRDNILAEFRNPDRSEKLSRAVGAFFQSVSH